MSVLFIVLGYLCGCLNGAYYVGKIRANEDIRTLGSANAGARNAGRIYGKKAFVLTVMIDALKTIIPLLLVLYFMGADSMLPAWTGLAVLIGHIWPVQLQFQGGKGVVVFLAAVLVMEPFVLLPVGILALSGLFFRDYFTVFGLIGLATIPVTAALLSGPYFGGILLILLIIVIVAHVEER